MKKQLKWITVAAMWLAVSLMSAAPLTDSDFLQANGRNLRKNYGQGDVVQLKGTNLGGWLIQEFWMTPTNSGGGVTCERDIYNKLIERFGETKMREIVDIYQSNYLKEADFDNMASMGMNCVRLPFWWRNLTDANGNLYSDWYKYIDWTIQQAKSRGMYVIIDFHGAPGSQNGSDHSGVDGGDNKIGASEFFFGANATANQNLYYSLWETIATRYKNEPAVAGYDLLNEPYCTYRYNSGYSADQLHTWLWNIYNTAYQRIRAIDSKHVIIMEATWDPVDLPNPATYNWTNVMYEYHNYLYDDYDNNEGRQITNMQSKLNAIKAAAYNVPSYMGEFCYFNNLTAWDQGLALLNNSGINWTTWTYKVVSTYGNWGLVNQNVSSTNVATDSEANIRTKWGNVGSSYNNTGLINVASTYFNKPAVKNNLGPAESNSNATRYESENASISGGNTESQSFYSNGAGVGAMNTSTAENGVAADWSNVKYVEYTVNIASAGDYRITLGYNGNGADGMKVLYRVNGGANQALTLNNNGASWNTMNTAEFTVSLNAGNNTIRISGTIEVQSNWANQDYIDVEQVGIAPSAAIQVTARTLDIATATNPQYGGWTRYEGEAAYVKGGVVENQSFYSGGAGVGSLNSGVALANVAADWSNINYVRFNVNVPTTATYRVLLQYNGDDDKMILARTPTQLYAITVPAVNAAHTWNLMHVVLFDLELQAGDNELYISGTINNASTWLNIDCIDVCRIPLQVNGNTVRYEAEYGIIKANRAVGEETQSFYSNLWGVGGMGSNVALANVANDLSNVYYVTFPIFVETAGTYKITLAYNGNGNTMTAKYRLNNGNATTYTMYNSGMSWNDMNYVRLNVHLNAGMNTVTFAGSSTGSWDDWVNFDYVDVAPTNEPVQVAQTAAVALQCVGMAGGVKLSLDAAERVVVYSLSGKQVSSYLLDAGEHRLPLVSGRYLLTTRSDVCKVVVP
ncbi:MAG: cellulase family glycosylhydrolase [Paludibacteraceae bacterium]|nr:cellulase family glycosylhydrolase [Paludibacteraceae bacterium]